MIIFKKKKCTKETTGTIIKVWFNGNGSRRVTVQYFVDTKSYTIKENITVKSSAIKIGKIPIGQKKTEYITAGLGEKVIVLYDPECPKRAYLKDNIGKYV